MKLRSGRIMALGVLLVAVGALAPAQGVASNNYVSRWIDEGLQYRSPDSTTITGSLTFSFHHGQQQIACHVAGTEPIEGGYFGETPGTDETTSFSATGCESTKGPPCVQGQWEVTATGLPWPSHLENGPEPMVEPESADVIEGVQLAVHCTSQVSTFHYTGFIRAWVGQNVLIFEGTDKKELAGDARVVGRLAMTDEGGNQITAGQFCVHFCH
jgi:hypothetical protein